MAEDRLNRALGRIEDAISRIDAAAAKGNAQPSAEVESLKEAHRALRGKVQSAIDQIDSLLHSQGAR
jgi:HAMP domain-containing protein